MKLVERTDIDLTKWDHQVSDSIVENIFQYSWYLDAVCTNWAALITDDYKTILPVPFTKKLGVKQMIQAPFTREYDILGNEFSWNEALQFLATHFKGIHFRNSEKDIIPGGKKRQHQWLDLTADFQEGYSTNAKRILKKTDSFRMTETKNPSVLIDLFKQHVAHKIDTISAADVVSLEKLMCESLKHKTGELWSVYAGDELVAGGFFLLDKKRVTYLKGASTEASKKAGAMYFLMDQAMLRYKATYNTFDFGGSEIDTVAGFYHKFGAQDRAYYDYTIDDLPFWFKTLKKLKR